MTMDELLDKMQRGAVDAKETIGRFIEYTNKKVAHELPNALKNLGNEMTRLKNQFFFFRAAMGEAGVTGGLVNLTGGLSNLMYMMQPVAEFLSGVFERAVWLILTPIELMVATVADFANYLGITDESLKTNTANILMWVAAIIPAAGFFFLSFKSVMLFAKGLGFVLGVLGKAVGLKFISKIFAIGPIGKATMSLALFSKGLFKLIGRFIPLVGVAWTLWEIFQGLGGWDWLKGVFPRLQQLEDKLRELGILKKKLTEEEETIVEQGLGKEGSNTLSGRSFMRHLPAQVASNFTPPTVAESANMANSANKGNSLILNKQQPSQPQEVNVIVTPNQGADKFVDIRVQSGIMDYVKTLNNGIAED